MSEFSAFLAGLILGDTSGGKSPKRKHVATKTNIALQDVAFCQCLRAAIDGLDRYVNSKHPSPEEFIRYLLPDTSGFVKPYAEDEERAIASNEAKVRQYVLWAETSLVGDKKWEELDAIHMIWQNEAHTPDPNNLDLLLGDYNHSEPVKKGGRIYEYKDPNQLLLGLASGFFESIPAKLILKQCLSVAQGTVISAGYAYDRTRFEASADAQKRKKERAIAYKRLLEKHPRLYLPISPWSPLTAKVREIYEYDNGERASLSAENRKRRKDEARLVALSLTKDETEEFNIFPFIKRKWNLVADWIIAIYLLATVALFITALATKSLPVGIAAIVLVTVMLVALIAFVATGGFTSRRGYIAPAVLDYVTLLQDHYYDKKDDIGARRYEELLNRINK